MAVREYIGARYVPVFADPLNWSITREYEPLTVVTHQGNSYVSRQFVPAGIAIGNDSYWALAFNFNAQIEQYRNETQRVANSLDDVEANAVLTEMVVFGDSWSDLHVTDVSWPVVAANGLGLTLHDYAINGARMMNYGPSNLPGEIATFQADTSFNHDSVKYIVIMGGINDHKYENVSAENLANAIKNAASILRSECPHAQIMYVNNIEYPYNLQQTNYWQTVHFYLCTAGITSFNIDGAFGPVYFNDTAFHLVAGGQQYLGKMVAEALSTGVVEFLPYKVRHNFSDGSKLTYIPTKHGSTISITVRIDTGSTSTNKEEWKDIASFRDKLPWGDCEFLLGTIGTAYNRAICQLGLSQIIFLSEQTQANGHFVFNCTNNIVIGESS